MAPPLEDRKKLVNAKALQSLRDEMHLQGVLDKPSWTSVHSHHFFDTKDNLWRELDAVATRTWKGSLQRRPIRVKVVILVESKRLAEKQLLLPKFDPLRQAIIFDWIGSQRRSPDRFALYQQVGLDQDLANRVDSEIAGGTAAIMPDAPNLLRPSPAGWDAAGFIEAQNAQGKVTDLEASVVWRARLALRSAAQALSQLELEASAQDLALGLKFARLRQMVSTQQDFDLYSEIIAQMRDRTFTITVFHPMVVVDADLWGVTRTDICSVRHARIHLTGVSRFPYYWFDVAHRDAAESVIAAAQTGYDRQATEKGLTPEDQHIGYADYEVAYP